MVASSRPPPPWSGVGWPLPLRPAHRQRRAVAAHLPGRAGAGPVPDPAGLAGPVRPTGRRGPVGPGRGGRAVPGGFHALWSGAAFPGDDGGLLVEGVAGFGDDFMLARAARTLLPEHVLRDIGRIGARAAAAFGPVRLEWAHDGDDAWVLQLHLVPWRQRTPSPSIPASPRAGTASTRRRGWSGCGSGSPRAAATRGVEVAGDVGVTSHAGDLLRRAAIPSRPAGTPDPR
jgi:hypothetical protein